MGVPNQHLRYPIGKFVWPQAVSAAELEQALDEIACAPALLREAVAGLSEAQLETPYRPDGWTVRQVIHHVADSHINCYTRFRLALTEDNPEIKPYAEDRWAMLADAATAPLELSFTLLESMHARWVLLMRSFGAAEWARTFRHPQMATASRLDVTVMLYAWHGRHHAAHITSLRQREGW